jgi:hypothetical protein
MSVLPSLLAIAISVALVDCIGGETKRQADAPAPASKTSNPAVGGGPRDPYPEWCSAYVAPVPADRSSLPPAGSPVSPGFDPCPLQVLPPLNPPPPPPRTR